MIVKANKKEWDVNECTYKQRRLLHKLNSASWKGGKMDVERYYDLLEKVHEISGLNESEFDGMTMTDIDIVLQAIFLAYLKIEKK